MTLSPTATTNKKRKHSTASLEKQQQQKQQPSSGGKSTKADKSTQKSSSGSAVRPSMKTTKTGTKTSTSQSSTTTASQQLSPDSRNSISFRLATYNIWFGDVHHEERMTAIAQNVLFTNNPPKPTGKEDVDVSPLWFIGLQEVTHDLAPLLTPFLESSGYRMVYQPFQQYGTALAIHEDCKVIQSGFVPFQTTVMDRGMLYAIATLPPRSVSTTSQQQHEEILVVTTHLESYLRPDWNGATQRQAQAKEMKTFCGNLMKQRPALQLAVVMGDFNWDDERVRMTKTSAKTMDVPLMTLFPTTTNDDDSDHVVVVWQDAWRETHSTKDPGYTYDSKLNPMLRGSLRRRFDRCLICTKSNNDEHNNNHKMVVEETRLIGQQAIPGLIWKKQYTQPNGNVVVSDREVCASDHFGLVIQLRIGP